MTPGGAASFPRPRDVRTAMKIFNGVVLLAAVAAILAACSGGPSDSSATVVKPTTSTAPPPGTSHIVTFDVPPTVQCTGGPSTTVAITYAVSGAEVRVVVARRSGDVAQRGEREREPGGPLRRGAPHGRAARASTSTRTRPRRRRSSRRSCPAPEADPCPQSGSGSPDQAVRIRQSGSGVRIRRFEQPLSVDSQDRYGTWESVGTLFEDVPLFSTSLRFSSDPLRS